ncbi:MULTISPECIES: type II toxin-antitoxin system YafQ family toxin [Bacteria]|uniref:Type II toxin-antitoxin system mRNA interferase toxin, RelE/StbE family n=1 Tax=Campylobacter blaseri TaxID=2042961 RepID=A0A2P8QYC8_9BACT|nr:MULTISPECIES: type II toxin-antitoxin system YafQ family toxin [Bacteria]PSM51220.1 type II toxin-antitoxin system mRNA interferase toxin, RelE/StbE family [Campylobacter blaseri]PSM52107.1 type II toxin-antitoxin system mRNA interferase toxin, RelE/StbE family [Campylobacter blaseri]
MFEIEYTKSFKKSFKKLSDEDKVLSKEIIKKLSNNENLEAKYKDHNLLGKYKSFRECHIKPDLLLIYKKQKNILILTLVEIGSHSDLF